MPGLSLLHIQEYMKFFSGSKHNFGEYSYGQKGKAKSKMPGVARTVKNRLLTLEEYKHHLNGEKGLGIIPITETNTCTFSAIDVDVYDESLMPFVEAIERGRFPLVPFRSKSGGLHIYMFLKEETQVPPVLKLMKTFCRLLSIDLLIQRKKRETIEIFPKQMKLNTGEIGNWINLPYYNSEETSQCAIREGKDLSLTEALSYIKERQTTLSSAEELLKELDFNDAPPCLQMINFLNPTDKNSGRNNYLFSFGVYFKKKDEDSFEQSLHEINRSMKDPLEERELDSTIIASIKKKDYSYKCKESPCVDFCYKKECAQREFGIGKNEGYFSSVECGQLYQYKTMSPYYEWEVRLQGQEEMKKLRFKSEDEIIQQHTFLRLCMRELYELPSKLKQSVWFEKVNTALKEVKIISIDKDDDTSPYMLLRALIVEFVTGRANAVTKDQILAKRVYYDSTLKEYIFRVKDLNEWVYVTKQFKYFTPSELHGILRELNCTHKTIRTESKHQIRVMCFAQQQLENYEHKEVFVPDFKIEEENF